MATCKTYRFEVFQLYYFTTHPQSIDVQHNTSLQFTYKIIIVVSVIDWFCPPAKSAHNKLTYLPLCFLCINTQHCFNCREYKDLVPLLLPKIIVCRRVGWQELNNTGLGFLKQLIMLIDKSDDTTSCLQLLSNVCVLPPSSTT